MTEPTDNIADAAANAKPIRTVLIVAPEDSAPRLPLARPLPWPSFESSIDAQAVLGKLASFTPNVDGERSL